MKFARSTHDSSASLWLVVLAAVACQQVLGFDHPDRSGPSSAGGRPSQTGAAGAELAPTSGGSDAPPSAGAGPLGGASAAGFPNAGSEHGGKETSGGAGGLGGWGPGGAGGAASGCATAADCPNSYPEACDAHCVTRGDATECVLRARDADRDGHRSEACVADPGDDCDDTRDDVAPGAPELCDGRDNDCDDLLDLVDGLDISGNGEVFATHLPGTVRSPSQIIWSETAAAYAFTWASGPAHEEKLLLQTWDSKGMPLIGPLVVNGGLPGARNHALATAGDRFAVVWTSDLPQPTVYGREIAADGTLIGSGVMLTTDGEDAAGADVAAAGLEDGAWIATWTSWEAGASVVRARAWTSAGPTTEARILGDHSGGAPQLVSTGGTALALWSFDHVRRAVTMDPRLINLESLDSLFAAQSVGAGADGFVAAWQTSSSLSRSIQLLELTRQGDKRCGPVTIPADGFRPTSMTRSARGYLALHEDHFEALEVLDGCRPGQRFGIPVAPSARWLRAAPAGDRGFAFVWHDTNAAGEIVTSMRHLLGPNLCD